MNISVKEQTEDMSVLLNQTILEFSPMELVGKLPILSIEVTFEKTEGGVDWQVGIFPNKYRFNAFAMVILYKTEELPSRETITDALKHMVTTYLAHIRLAFTMYLFPELSAEERIQENGLCDIAMSMTLALHSKTPAAVDSIAFSKLLTNLPIYILENIRSMYAIPVGNKEVITFVICEQTYTVTTSSIGEFTTWFLNVINSKEQPSDPIEEMLVQLTSELSEFRHGNSHKTTLVPTVKSPFLKIVKQQQPKK